MFYKNSLKRKRAKHAFIVFCIARDRRKTTKRIRRHTTTVFAGRSCGVQRGQFRIFSYLKPIAPPFLFVILSSIVFKFNSMNSIQIQFNSSVAAVSLEFRLNGKTLNSTRGHIVDFGNLYLKNFFS